jgi:hypothetical protein
MNSALAAELLSYSKPAFFRSLFSAVSYWSMRSTALQAAEKFGRRARLQPCHKSHANDGFSH